MPFIFVIGPARSGTTLLGQCLSKHPDICYVEEPGPIWRVGNENIPHDMFTEIEARVDIKTRIVSWFASVLRKSKKKLLVEKTPANCLRLRFVKEIFPDSKVIFLCRDGEKIISSSLKRWKRLGDANNHRIANNRAGFGLFGKRVKKLSQVRAVEVIYYLPQIFEIITSLFCFKQRVWGPRFPGIREMLKTHSVAEICAYQWRASMEIMRRDMDLWDSERRLVVTYESFCSDPIKVLSMICSFMGIVASDDLLSFMAEEVGDDDSACCFSDEEARVVRKVIDGNWNIESSIG